MVPGERVVIERRISVHVVRRGKIARARMHPLLLKWNAAQHGASHFVVHDLQEIPNVRSLLNVVGQVKVGIVKQKCIRFRSLFSLIPR